MAIYPYTRTQARIIPTYILHCRFSVSDSHRIWISSDSACLHLQEIRFTYLLCFYLKRFLCLQTRKNCLGCEGRGQTWLLWPWNGEVWDPERREPGKWQITTLDFRRTYFWLFRELRGRMTWDTALERRGRLESQSIFKDYLLQVQDLLIRFSRRSCKGGWTPCDEQGTPGKTGVWKEGVQEVQAGTSAPG